MKGAKEKKASLVDIEVDNFRRVCEFARRGDYDPPTSEDFSESDYSWRHRDFFPNQRPKSRAGDAVDTYQTQTNNSQEVPETDLSYLKQHFFDRCYLRSESLRAAIPEEIPNPDGSYYPSNGFPIMNFESTFLDLARLYAFAEQWMAQDLKVLTLHKLHGVLRHFNLFTSCRPAVMKLVRFAYNSDHTPGRGHSGQIDELRELVVEFMAMHARAFMNYENHRCLLNEEGEYAGDLMHALQEWRL